jgi:hypothetical protein
MAEVVEHLSHKGEDLSSNPIFTKNKIHSEGKSKCEG